MRKKKRKWLFPAVLILFTMIRGSISINTESSDTSFFKKLEKEVLGAFGKTIENSYMPCLTWGSSGQTTLWLLQEQMEHLLPFYGYMGKMEVEENRIEQVPETEITYLSEEDLEELTLAAEQPKTEAPEKSVEESTLKELLQAENEAAALAGGSPESSFVPHTQKQVLELERLQNFETLLTDFYTVDTNTMVGSDQLNLGKLSEPSMQLSEGGEGPQILIYHTHSKETFADSVEGDAATSIVGVGDYLCHLLADTYGYRVLHHTESYDADSRDDAYSKALPEITRVLEENPSIEVVIDLHRDEMPEGTRLVTDLDGRATAKFMFFNGLSRTKKTGNISYLYNENLDENLAFSFQMQKKAYEYYPGLTRKIYLKGYRYNMHLKPKSLLIELGAQNNTLEEAKNACEPLAHILHLVLSGQ